MAKSATMGKNSRGPQSSATFLNEQSGRGVLGNGKQVMPRPQFVQPDNGTFSFGPGQLGPHYNPSTAPMKVGNVTTDLAGGLY